MATKTITVCDTCGTEMADQAEILMAFEDKEVCAECWRLLDRAAKRNHVVLSQQFGEASQLVVDILEMFRNIKPKDFKAAFGADADRKRRRLISLTSHLDTWE